MSKQVAFWLGSIVGICVSACCWWDELEEAEKSRSDAWQDGYKTGKRLNTPADARTASTGDPYPSRLNTRAMGDVNADD